MKKCPSCYAIMKETAAPAQVPTLQKKPVEHTLEVAEARTRYECPQCGHIEELVARPAAATRP